MSAPKFTWTDLGPDWAPPPEEVARQERAKRNRRLQCNCGRFVKASTFRDLGMYALGRHSVTWTCSLCGPTGDGA